MTHTDDRLWTRFRWIMWAGAAFILLLPLLARAPWTGSDYLLMGLLLGTACAIVELAVRASRDGAYRLGSLVAVGTGFLLIWVNLAVGFLGSENNPANLVFLGVLAVAAAGTLTARGNAPAMARTMFATMIVQAVVAPGAWLASLSSAGAAGIYEVAIGTTLFCCLWLLSGMLFLRSARTAQKAAAV
jgi:hypothetical protein